MTVKTLCSSPSLSSSDLMLTWCGVSSIERQQSLIKSNGYLGVLHSRRIWKESFIAIRVMITFNQVLLETRIDQ